MGSDQKRNFYEVLGVDKNADERAVKKAYFGLVRKFPPETHPEEFKRIREAYEVLSNPQSRQDYDSVNQYDHYGEAVSAQMRAGMEAMDAGDYASAQRAFHEVLRLQPQLHFARDLLGMAYLNSDQAREALAHFDALIQAQPDNHVYHLHKGYAHYHQKQYLPAMSAFRDAQKRDASDTRVLVAMADALAAQNQYEAALAELDRAIHMDGQVDFQDFVFFMRKVQIQLLRNRADLAEQDLDQIFKILPEDPETRKYVATRLASLAADLFAMKRSVDANRLLQRCKMLDPTRKSMEFQFPSRTTLPIAVLPKASQDWIAQHCKEWAAGKLLHNAWLGPIMLLIGAIIVELAILNASFGAKQLWSAPQALWISLFVVGGPLFLGLAIRRVRRVAKSPFGKYTTIHPLHLIQVDVDKVTLWPLVNLHDVSLTHHSTNGIYQQTAVRMDFAGTLCNLSIRGQEASVDWANRLLAQRRRVLELMSMGLLDAEDGYDMVPPEQLAASGPKKPSVQDKAARERSLRWYLSCAGVGVVLAIIAVPYNKGAAERALWRRCSRSSSISAYRRYLETFPKGRHAFQAQEGMNEGYDEAIRRYRDKTRAAADSKGPNAIIGVVNALKEANTKRVKIVYESSFDFMSVKGLHTKELGDVTPPHAAFSGGSNKIRESSITSALRRSFHDMFSSEVIDFDDGADYYDSDHFRFDGYGRGSRNRSQETPSPVTFVVKYKVGPSGSIYESATGSRQKMYGILFDWDFTIKMAGDAAEAYRLQLSSAPAKNIRYTTYGNQASSDVTAYTKMAESAFDEFGQKLAEGFGVHIAPRPNSDSGYGGLGVGRYKPPVPRYGLSKRSKSRGFPPETQKLIDDLRERDNGAR